LKYAQPLIHYRQTDIQTDVTKHITRYHATFADGNTAFLSV